MAPLTSDGRSPVEPGALEGARVMVADDIAENRALLRDLLEAHGVEVLEAEDGIAALELVASTPPDVVLLDLQMPRMDGFETCRRLKSSEDTAKIPVLLVTALDQREHRLAGIGAGANDFITKPIDGADLVLRVRNAVRMRELHRQVERQYARVKQQEKLREDLVHMLVHDLRAPLSALSLTLHIVAEDLDPDSETRVDVLEAARCTRDVTDMVGDVLDVSRLEAGEMPLDRSVIDLGEVCRAAVQRVTGSSERHRIRTEAPETPTTTLGDRKVLERVVGNLVDNALKYHGGHEPVRVALERRPGGIRMSVEDRGPGVSAEARERIFDKFGQAGAAPGQRRSTGLGLTYCRLAVEAHGGRIGLDPRDGGGSTFWFEIDATAAEVEDGRQAVGASAGSDS